MKKHLLILLLLPAMLCGSAAFAQEKQSNATWEETVNFLQKYHFGMEWECASANARYCLINKIKIQTDRLELEEEDGYSGDVYKRTLYFKDLFSAWRFAASDVMVLQTIRDDILVYTNGKQRNSSSEISSKIKVRVVDRELFLRLLKAWQHLAWLATEKRRAAAEAAGDKF
ncbi:MAG: hypothetical protein OXH57_05800 [Ekhidna sp.]|nr:hypothetical protein [Ekhidna sp.]